MRGRLILAVAAPLLVLGASFAAAIPAAAAPGPAQPSYYLALGDSLSVGWQPIGPDGTGIVTDRGYVNDLYAALRPANRDLRLEDLGCSGETSTTMLKGGICPYSQGSQLAAAVSFLATHRVSLVTLDIGANDVDGCVVGGAISPTCIAGGLSALGVNLPIILTALRTAAPHVRMVAMSYYDPFLAEWLTGAAGQALARESVTVAADLNAILVKAYDAFGVGVANVSGAFLTTDFRLLPFIQTPLNVSLICAWTWMCAPPPRGPDIHPNDLGYAVIAGAFLGALRDRHLG